MKRLFTIAFSLLTLWLNAQTLQYNRYATTPDGTQINGNTLTNLLAGDSNSVASLVQVTNISNTSYSNNAAGYASTNNANSWANTQAFPGGVRMTGSFFDDVGALPVNGQVLGTSGSGVLWTFLNYVQTLASTNGYFTYSTNFGVVTATFVLTNISGSLISGAVAQATHATNADFATTVYNLAGATNLQATAFAGSTAYYYFTPAYSDVTIGGGGALPSIFDISGGGTWSCGVISSTSHGNFFQYSPPPQYISGTNFVEGFQIASTNASAITVNDFINYMSNNIAIYRNGTGRTFTTLGGTNIAWYYYTNSITAPTQSSINQYKLLFYNWTCQGTTNVWLLGGSFRTY